MNTQLDPVLGQFEHTTCLDCNDTVSIDFIGEKTGTLHCTICLCGKCADRLDTTTAKAKGAAKAGEPLREERFDGREFDEDGFPIGAKPTVGTILQTFTTRLKTGRKEVQGYAVSFEGFEGFSFFTYQMIRDDGTPGNWHVIECTSGMGAGMGFDTIAKAVARARQNLTKAGIEKLRQLIQKAA